MISGIKNFVVQLIIEQSQSFENLEVTLPCEDIIC